MEIKLGMIGLSGGNKFMQRAIRFFTRSEFSHSFVVVDGPYQVLSVLETTESIVCLSDFYRKDSEENYIEMWEPIIKIDTSEILKKAYLTSVGKYYGHLTYVWFIYDWVCSFFGYQPKIMWKWVNNGPTCTALVCEEYLSKIFPHLFENIDFSTMTPEKLRKIMLNNPDKFKYLGWYKMPK